MIRLCELLDLVVAYNPNTDIELINRAYTYAVEAHTGQTRYSGAPYISHPLEVAAIIARMKLDDATIAAALLHDTIEDTVTTQSEINDLFGAEIGKLVKGLTKIKWLDRVSKKAQQAENFRNLLLATSDDIRILLVKLADRLHNMRTLDAVQEHKRQRIAQETMDIYAPLAGRMGMQDFRSELEERSFRILFPDSYQSIIKNLTVLKERNRGIIASIEHDLTCKLAEGGIPAKVKGREKQAYSIWRKMENKRVSFEQLSDVFGFRIIVETTSQCYAALGIVHLTWPVVPGRFKDYISTPKQNDYRSIHTTVINSSRQRVELQIRTMEMDQVAEYGIAAHALYKDNQNGQTKRPNIEDTNAVRWLRRLTDFLEAGDTPEEMLENTKLELFQDQVFCLTPKGLVIALPKGATPIDFAYVVHTDIGNSCVGCKINGQLAPLISTLNNGDEVEIICSNRRVPPVAWESITITGKARAAIRRATRSAIRKQYVGLGRQIVESAFEHAKRPYSDQLLAAVLHRLARGNNVDDVLAAVGRGEAPAAHVIKAIYPDFKENENKSFQTTFTLKKEDGWHRLRRVIGFKFRFSSNNRNTAQQVRRIPIRGQQNDLPIHFAPSGAIPGDRIVGILSPGKGILIYPIESPSLSRFESQPERWIDVYWDVSPENTDRFPVHLKIQVRNEPGALAMITHVISEHESNIDEMEMTALSDDFREINLHLEVRNVKHLMAIMLQIRKKVNVSSVKRIFE